MADAGDLRHEVERLGRRERRAVEHVASAGAPALGREDVRLGGVGDVDHADVGVDEHRQPAVDVVDDQLAVAVVRPGPWTEEGLIATTSTPVRCAAANAACSPSCLERS